MRNRVSDNSVNSRGRIHLVDSVSAAQILSGHLAGCSLVVGTERAKGEDASRSHAKDPADYALFAHAQPNQRVAVAVLLQKAHQRNVVVESLGGAGDLVEVSGVSGHLSQSLVQLGSSAKIVEGQHYCRLGAQILNLRRLQSAGSLQFDINQLASRVGSLPQNIQFGRDRTAEFPAVGYPAASGDYRYVRMRFSELPDLSERETRTLKVV